VRLTVVTAEEGTMKNSSGTLIALAAGFSLALPLLAAERLAVKTGLWESTEIMQLSGVSIPEDQLQKMPPAQRAQMQEMLKKMGVGAPRTIVHKWCVTAKDLDTDNFFGPQEEGDKCQYKLVAGTSKRREWTFQCNSADGAGSGHVVIEATSDTQAHGTMDGKMAQAAGAGSMNAKFDAKWVSSSCAGADDN
jgi:Protein of unknown function (DUF3617)